MRRIMANDIYEVLILIVMEERIGFASAKDLGIKIAGGLNPYCNGRKNRISTAYRW